MLFVYCCYFPLYVLKTCFKRQSFEAMDMFYFSLEIFSSTYPKIFV